MSKKEKYHTPPSYKQTTRLLKIWISRQKNIKKRQIAEKIARKNHTSIKRAYSTTLPYLKLIAKKNKQEAEKISQYLELDKDEQAWMRK